MDDGTLPVFGGSSVPSGLLVLFSGGNQTKLTNHQLTNYLTMARFCDPFFLVTVTVGTLFGSRSNGAAGEYHSDQSGILLGY